MRGPQHEATPAAGTTGDPRRRQLNRRARREEGGRGAWAWAWVGACSTPKRRRTQHP